MRNDNQTANLFANSGQGQGIATANTRVDRLALALTDALSSVYARLERPIARPPIARAIGPVVDGVTVVKRPWVAAKMRSFHAHFPRLGGGRLQQWLRGCRVLPVMCSVS